MDVKEKLSVDRIRNDEESHIVIDQEKCSQCTTRPCLTLCPGSLYERNSETGETTVEHSGCLECGTCLIACVMDALKWNYPKGQFGVQYRMG